MNQRAWLILSLAAVFGLKAPLCVVACMEELPATSVASSAHHSEESAPCHDSAPASSEEAPPAEHECDCDRVQVVLSKAESTEATSSFEIAGPVSAPIGSIVPPSEPASARSWTLREDLPPPDVLLLKSTLLI